MRILFQKQTPKVVCHKCPSPILLLTPLSKYSGTMGGVQMKVIVAVSSWALLVLKSVGILPFISKVSITSSRTNPSFRPGSDCDIWQCMIQNRQGIEMAGAADGQDPIIQRPFFFFHVCSQLCCFSALVCLWPVMCNCGRRGEEMR